MLQQLSEQRSSRERDDKAWSYSRTQSGVGLLRAAEAAPPERIRVLGTSRVVHLHGARFSVGASRRNDLVLADPYVSKRHCTFQVQADGLWIQDEASRNGTWINDVRVERCRVRSGARVVVGKTSLLLVGSEHQQPSFGIVGRDPSMLRVLGQIERLGPTSSPVLILGETGTGKELVARALHECSPSRMAPLEALNCGAIPRDLAEAELFGHTQGAFTGATQQRKGAFERADGGTLFLDEVGEMPLELQPKLLRVLEEGLVQRLGEEQRRPVAVRVVAATHRNLLRDAEQGRFRLDLYHRLAVGVIELPPLRERVEDIPLLAQHFLGQGQASGVSLGPQVLGFLQQQPWYGNVRELRNAIHRALAEGDRELRVEHFAFLAAGHRLQPLDGAIRYVGRSFAEIRRELYSRVLDSCGGNCAAAAAALGIPKSTFYDQLRAMKLLAIP